MRVFSRNMGCLEPGCRLCAWNSHRQCKRQFAKHFLEGDLLKAECTAPISIIAVNQKTGQPVEETPEGMELEVRA